jgi:4-hydroxy-tetrahydrodipicolinate reductase
MKLGISGSRGRMGKKITEIAVQDHDIKLTVLLEHDGHPEAGKIVNGVKVVTDNSEIKNCEVFIEFTTPEATLINLEACEKNGVSMVIGTTGMSPEEIGKIKEAAKQIPIVFSSNMSIGVNALFKAAELVAQKLRGIKDITVYEEHHIHKKDKPSGTAKTIAEVVEKASGHPVRFLDPLREGEIIGNHELVFETDFDVFKMYHHAKDRSMFAMGAVTAAKFLVGKPAGLYDMQDVLGFKELRFKN